MAQNLHEWDGDSDSDSDNGATGSTKTTTVFMKIVEKIQVVPAPASSLENQPSASVVDTETMAPEPTGEGLGAAAAVPFQDTAVQEADGNLTPVASTSSSWAPPPLPADYEIDGGKVTFGRSSLTDTFKQYDEMYDDDRPLNVTIGTWSREQYNQFKQERRENPYIHPDVELRQMVYAQELKKFAAKKRARRERMMNNPASLF